MGDLVIAWRLYVVWGKKLWIAIPPTIMVIGEFSKYCVAPLFAPEPGIDVSAVCGYGSIFQWLLPHPNPVEIAHWGQGIFVISLTANIVVTALIAGRIWCVSPWHSRRLVLGELTPRTIGT